MAALTIGMIAIAVIFAALLAIHAYAQWTIRNVDEANATPERVEP